MMISDPCRKRLSVPCWTGRTRLPLCPREGEVAHVPSVRVSDGGRLSGGDPVDCFDEGSSGGFKEQADSGRGDLHGDEA